MTSKNKFYECVECDAHFRIKHEQDGHHYSVKFCPFCGEDLPEDTLLDMYAGDDKYSNKRTI